MKPGSRLSHYQILSRLGEGGIGTVYRAEDTRLGRIVALKVLRPELVSDEDTNRRFQQEARVASALSHPGIATLFEFQREGDIAFLTMEFVEGKSLREILQQGPLPILHLQECAWQMAAALAEAHRRGIVHRDLKPENVMRSDSGFYKILDFGLAKVLQEPRSSTADETRADTRTKQLTEAGSLLGTAAYMSPEQAQGESVDARSDIFSFGVLLYELATGISPFRRNNAIGTFHAVVHEEPKPIREIRPEIPEEFEAIIFKCFAKKPTDRFQTVEILAEKISGLFTGLDSSVRRLFRSPRPVPPSRNRWMIGIGALAGLALLALLFLYIGSRSASAPFPPAPQPPSSSLLPAASSRGTIAVAPFTNSSGDPDADWLRRGIPEMLTTGLAQSGELKVISSQKLSDLLTMSGAGEKDKVDGATATELARWAGAEIVVSGSIFKEGENFRIDVQAYNTETGTILTAAKVEGNNIFHLVDRLTADLQRDLGVATLAGGEMRAVSTSSENAYRFYSEGIDLYNNLRFAESSERFRRSIEADPFFAQAKMRMGMSLYLDGKETEGLSWVEEAEKDRDSMPELDRRLAGMFHSFFHDRDPEEGERRLQILNREFPQDAEGAFWKARALSDIGEDQTGAIRILRGLIVENPGFLPAVPDLSLHLMEIGEAKAAEKLLVGFLPLYPGASRSLNHLIEMIQEGDEDLEEPAAISGSPGEG